jgi:hypothetical protein
MNKSNQKVLPGVHSTYMDVKVLLVTWQSLTMSGFPAKKSRLKATANLGV